MNLHQLDQRAVRQANRWTLGFGLAFAVAFAVVLIVVMAPAWLGLPVMFAALLGAYWTMVYRQTAAFNKRFPNHRS